MEKLLRRLFLVLFVLLLVAGCASKEETKIYENIEELNGQKMGCMSGSIFDQLIAEKFKDSEIVYFGSRSELLLGLTSGKIDGFISDEPVAMMMVKQNSAVKYLPEDVGEVKYGICFSDDANDKLVQFNQYLTNITTNGHLKELQEKWINIDGASQKKVELELTGENGVLRCVTTPDAAPFSFMSENVFQGYEVELLNEFAHEYGYTLEISTVNFDALLTSIAMNKYDIAFNGIYITPEREKSVDFCNSTYTGKDVVMVRSGDIVTEDKDIITSIKESFYRNFIEEDRFLLLLRGVLITLNISVVSIGAGSMFGLLLYVLSKENSALKSIIDNVQRIMAKLPAVVILMLLFYVVFNDSSIAASVVSILGFSFMFGHTVYGLINAGDASVDYGQKEAAKALGYGQWLSFFHIIMPQILKIIRESYIREVISLIKNTSIVGYVSVNDVTRSSDIIRGRTYDALFPLIVVALLYYFLCTVLVDLIQIPIDAYINKKVKYHD